MRIKLFNNNIINYKSVVSPLNDFVKNLNPDEPLQACDFIVKINFVNLMRCHYLSDDMADQTYLDYESFYIDKFASVDMWDYMLEDSDDPLDIGLKLDCPIHKVDFVFGDTDSEGRDITSVFIHATCPPEFEDPYEWFDDHSTDNFLAAKALELIKNRSDINEV